jgi:uncharacterized protein (TIGR02145 family)
MKTLFSIILIALTSAFSLAQTTTLGTQVWSTKNLEVSTFRNGDPIFYAQTDEEWEKAGTDGQPAWSYFEHDPKNEATYGKLYNWHAVNDTRGLAPEGWRIPSDGDWNKLFEFLGGKTNASQKMKSIDLWEANTSMSGAGDNSSGFSAEAGGQRAYTVTFNDDTNRAYYWSITPEGTTYRAWEFFIRYDNTSLVKYNNNKTGGNSIRCLKD